MQDDAFRAGPRSGPAPNGLAAKRQRDMSEFPRRFGPYVLLKPLARGGMGALYLALAGPGGQREAVRHQDGAAAPRRQGVPAAVPRRGEGRRAPVARQPGAGVRCRPGRAARCTSRWTSSRARTCARPGTAARRRGSRFPSTSPRTSSRSSRAACDYAHGFGDIKLVHRDVSPPNVLLSYSGEVRLTDFGLASSTLKLEKTAPGIIYGKVSYMSPEQARGETARRPHRSVRVGHHPVGAAHRAAAVSVGQGARGAQGRPHLRGDPAARAQSRARRRRRDARRACRPSSTHRAEGAGARSRRTATRAARRCATIWPRSWPRRRPATERRAARQLPHELYAEDIAASAPSARR